mgnify:CR=1 FL=1
MMKSKRFKHIAIITVLSAVCAFSMGCSNTEKPEPDKNTIEEPAKEIIINNPNSAADELINSETNQGADTNTNTNTVVDNDIIPLGNTKTIDGYQTVDGASLPVTATFEVADIQRGENAYAILQSHNAELSKPDDSMEYIIVTLNITYDKGEADYLDLYENNASLDSEKRFFALSNGDSNAEQMTEKLSNSVYDMSIKKGDSGQGAVAFLHKTDSNEPLNFIGFNNVIKFDITN